MSGLFIGALIAAVALAFVLWPMVAPGRAKLRKPRPKSMQIRDDSAVRALREIEFDRATGKLADSDYDALKSEYTARALTELRDADALKAAAVVAAVPGADLAEALVQAARDAAVTCGRCDSVCPEPDAVYCSSCGWYLPGQCSKCGTEVEESGARFCASCGWALAA